MPSIISHAVVAVALKAAFPAPSVPRRLMILGAACAVAPDIDVIGFGFGIEYGDLLGHRGLVFLYLFLATASHGLLDALTDGGMGVAFFAPFHNARYFFPVAPISVSPIGLTSFISTRGLHVILSELLWVWLPSVMFAAAVLSLRRLSPGGASVRP
jgi:inner membrane protein